MQREEILDEILGRIEDRDKTHAGFQQPGVVFARGQLRSVEQPVYLRFTMRPLRL